MYITDQLFSNGGASGACGKLTFAIFFVNVGKRHTFLICGEGLVRQQLEGTSRARTIFLSLDPNAVVRPIASAFIGMNDRFDH